MAESFAELPETHPRYEEMKYVWVLLNTMPQRFADMIPRKQRCMHPRLPDNPDTIDISDCQGHLLYTAVYNKSKKYFDRYVGYQNPDSKGEQLTGRMEY